MLGWLRLISWLVRQHLRLVPDGERLIAEIPLIPLCVCGKCCWWLQHMLSQEKLGSWEKYLITVTWYFRLASKSQTQFNEIDEWGYSGLKRSTLWHHVAWMCSLVDQLDARFSCSGWSCLHFFDPSQCILIKFKMTLSLSRALNVNTYP